MRAGTFFRRSEQQGSGPAGGALMWQHTGGRRPSFAIEPAAGQESVWDYPRPPKLVQDSRIVEVVCSKTTIARSSRCFRILETASPPTFYIPPVDVRVELLVEAPGNSFCEWKGAATYWSLQIEGDQIPSVAWSYPNPAAPYAALRGCFSFYPSRVDCFVDGERVRPQAGKFYGGWITNDVVGPFKGEPGTAGW